MQRVHLASSEPEFRMVFAVDCQREEHTVLDVRLHESNVFGNVTTLGTTEHE
jgi:hypothetical protein